jgi:hypothetical protein
MSARSHEKLSIYTLAFIIQIISLGSSFKMEAPILFDPKVHSYLIPSLAAAHASAILNPPFMIATFLPPLKQDVMQAWWEDRAKEVAAGQRHIIMQLQVKRK